MRNVNARFDNLDAFVATVGTKIDAVRYAPNKGVSLSNATTYYVPLGSSESGFVADCPLIAAHVQWPAAFVAAITVEGTNFPAFERGLSDGVADTQDWDVNTAGLWVPINPTGAYGAAVGAGNLYASSGLTAGGTNAGGGVIVLPAMPFRRARLAVVVTTGALVRFGAHGILV